MEVGILGGGEIHPEQAWQEKSQYRGVEKEVLCHKTLPPRVNLEVGVCMSLRSSHGCMKESQVSRTRRKLESCGQWEKMCRNSVNKRDLVIGNTVRFSLSRGVMSAGPPELAK